MQVWVNSCGKWEHGNEIPVPQPVLFGVKHFDVWKAFNDAVVTTSVAWNIFAAVAAVVLSKISKEGTPETQPGTQPGTAGAELRPGTVVPIGVQN